MRSAAVAIGRRVAKYSSILCLWSRRPTDSAVRIRPNWVQGRDETILRAMRPNNPHVAATNRQRGEDAAELGGRDEARVCRAAVEILEQLVQLHATGVHLLTHRHIRLASSSSPPSVAPPDGGRGEASPPMGGRPKIM